MALTTLGAAQSHYAAGHGVPAARSAIPAVLVPGMNNSARMWQDVLSALPGDIAGIAIDCPPLEDVDAIADDLLAGLPRRFVAVGHSFGGYVVLAMLAREPERLHGVVLVNSIDTADSPEQAAGRRRIAAEVDADTYESTAMSLAARAYHPDNAADQRLLELRAEGIGEYGPGRYRAHLRAAAARPDRRELLERSAVPVLVLTADHDEAIAGDAQTAMARRVGAQQRVIERTGHLLPAERPTAVADEIANFARAVVRS